MCNLIDDNINTQCVLIENYVNFKISLLRSLSDSYTNNVQVWIASKDNFVLIDTIN